MHICPKCRVEMSCKKNGFIAAWHEGTYAKRGDLFECRKCGNEMLEISRNTESYSLTQLEIHREKLAGNYIEMPS